MEQHGISEEEVHAVLEEADEMGKANFSRLFAQKLIGHRLIRVIYNQGAGETVVITVMLRRKDGDRS